MGDVGPWRRWEAHDEQPHLAGPALFGRVPLGGRQTLKYGVGLLFGLTDGAATSRLRARLEFEF